MKIEFDKAFLWLLPYLYVISIFYYWGYWGTFNVDAFSYYDVGDIIKGVISPFRSILYYIISIVGLYQLNELIHAPLKEKIKSLKAWVAVVIAIFLTFTGVGIFAIIWFGILLPFITSTPEVNNWIRFLILNNLSFLFGVIVVSAFEGTEWTLKTWLVILGIALPPRAFMGGKENALLIIENKVFNYTAADSLVYPEKNIYKYLGKAGGHNILLTMDNSKQIIIPSDKLVPLVIEGYSTRDEASIKRFRRNIKLVYGRPTN